MSKAKEKNQVQAPEVQKHLKEVKASEEMIKTVGDYFFVGGEQVRKMLRFVGYKDLRPLVQTFLDVVEEGNYTVYKGEVIIGCNCDACKNKEALLILLNLYEMDKCFMRASNSAIVSYLKMFVEV